MPDARALRNTSVTIASRLLALSSCIRELKLIITFPCMVCVTMVPPEHVWGVLGYVELWPWAASLGITAENAYFQYRTLGRCSAPVERARAEPSNSVQMRLWSRPLDSLLRSGACWVSPFVAKWGVRRPSAIQKKKNLRPNCIGAYPGFSLCN